MKIKKNDVIREDKLVFTKEDDCGTIPTGNGEITTPSPTVDGDIQNTTKGGSVKYDEIIGKNPIHKNRCDGFMGPGCLYKPGYIFTYPKNETKKKKRKFPKVIDLTESDEYQSFVDITTPLIRNIFNEVNEFLYKISPDLHAVYNKGYQFSENIKDCVALLDKEDQDDVNTMIICLNLPVIYNFLDENSLENDNDEIECQLRISIWHEVGHGLIQYFKDMEIYDMELTDKDEENIVEEFAKFKLEKFTGISKSDLNNYINDVFV